MSDLMQAGTPLSGCGLPCPRHVPICMRPADLLDGVGYTPVIKLRQVSEETGCSVYAKCEFQNPGGSIKDRIAAFIVGQAEKRGELRPGMTILEVTSGNTGIALSMVGARKGYKVRIMMPKTVSQERRAMIQGFGAELELIDQLTDILAAVHETQERAKKDTNLFLPSQFSNPDNPLCHETTTGPEILAQVPGSIDAFIMGVGTGGTLMGVGRALRKENPSVKIVAVEADESAVLSGDPPGHHGIQGLADGFIPDVVNVGEIDQVVRVKTAEAIEESHRITRSEGLLVGISSGANVLAARDVAQALGPGHTIVTMLPDRGERYLSMG